MAERLKTLLLDANGSGIKTLGFTTLRGAFGLDENSTLPFGLHRNRTIHGRLLARQYNVYSFIDDWREAFVQSPRLAVTACDINDYFGYRRQLKRIRDYDLIVLLHSATGQHMDALLAAEAAYQNRNGRMVVFFSNEYEFMTKKAEFINSTGTEFVCTQLPLDVASWIYHYDSSQLLSTSHALNPRLYRDTGMDRDVDIGFIGSLYHRQIGDKERTDLIMYFNDHGVGHGLACDIRLRNVPRETWAEFLNGCKGIVGAESGTYYLDSKGQIMDTVRRLLLRDRDMSFDAIWTPELTRDQEFRSGKAISSRHFEPIGTKTCQILVEGDYNGILKADEHYIAVKKDLSNIDNAIERFKDESYRSRIAQQAYEFVIENHTYDHRVATLLNQVFGTN